MKKITILGSTGSIGRNTLEIISRFPERFRVVGLAAKNNIQLLEEQIAVYRPAFVAVYDESAGRELAGKNLPVNIMTGKKGLIDIASCADADMVVSAIVGSAALLPTLAAIRAGKDIALASKEILVMAGSIVMTEALENGVKVLPVDSEHSAVFQCIDGKRKDEVKRIILTASGGPFFKKKLSELGAVTPEAALKHPNWDMGDKVTIDSATLMNKGLEVIEASWLFGLSADRIRVVLHPQSIVHSMVEFVDGSVIAQMSVPDMKGPISYALSYPRRFDNVLPSLDLSDIGQLTFEEPDSNRYPSLALTYKALEIGGTMPSVLNAANEVAVETFLAGRIPFTEISNVVGETMAQHKSTGSSSLDDIILDDIIKVSDWARKRAYEIVESLVR